jgi:DNA-binding LacI/PurR family transcriptional regulator
VQLKRAPARFQKVLSKIEGDILEGVYREDDVLPSDTELSKQHGVSVATARRAYSELVHRGWVKRVRKRGTILCREALGTRLRRVGLIMVADVPAFQILRSGIESALAEYSTAIETRWNLDVPSVNEEAIRRSISEGAHGLIVTPPIQSSFETMRQLMADRFPLVMVFNHDPKIHSIFPDDYRAGYLVGEHFAECGYRRVAAVVRENAIGRERLYGLREAVARHNLNFAEDAVIPISYGDEPGKVPPDLGRREAERLLALKDRPEAVFVYNDTHAVAIYHWLQNHGVAVPGEIAIAGVDALDVTYHPFSLTTVDIGIASMGAKAGKLLAAQVQNPNLPVVQDKITPHLRIGASTQLRTKAGSSRHAR